MQGIHVPRISSKKSSAIQKKHVEQSRRGTSRHGSITCARVDNEKCDCFQLTLEKWNNRYAHTAKQNNRCLLWRHGASPGPRSGTNLLRKLLSPLHTARVESCRRRAVCIEFATSSRQVLTDLVEKLKPGHVELSWVVSCGVYSPDGSRDPVSNSAANSDGIKCQHVQFSIFRPNPSWTSCEFNKHRRRRRDSTVELSWVGKFVHTCRDSRQLVADLKHTDTTKLDSWIASAVCIGH